MRSYKSIFIYGFAIFAMFFGSGNLVFPLQIGQMAGEHWIVAFLGLLITGILLPLAGLFVLKLSQGNYQVFFSEVGKTAGLLLPLMMLSLLGSFGVVPRCITVAYGSISYWLPGIQLLPFSLFFCILTFFFCLNDKTMVKALGQWMSPILLLMLLVLIGFAAVKSPDTTLSMPTQSAFSNGFTTGYQTMDLFAAFFFSALIFSQIQQQFPTASQRDILLFALKPSILGASLLALIYFGLVFLGAHYASLLKDTTLEWMLPAIAAKSMGHHATFFIGITMFFSCLTTAVALNNLYARYLTRLLRLRGSQFPKVMLATTLLSFIMSLLDFKGIAAFLAPILQLTYPGIIAITLMTIVIKEQKTLKKLVFYVMTFCMGIPLAIH